MDLICCLKCKTPKAGTAKGAGKGFFEIVSLIYRMVTIYSAYLTPTGHGSDTKTPRISLLVPASSELLSQVIRVLPVPYFATG